MKSEAAGKLMFDLALVAEIEGDEFHGVYFSREDDCYEGAHSAGLDAGDALIIIELLIQRFGLDRHVIAQMGDDDA